MSDHPFAAVTEAEVLDELREGPLSLGVLYGYLGVYSAPECAGSAMTGLESTGRIRFIGCDHAGNHYMACVVALVGA